MEIKEKIVIKEKDSVIIPDRDLVATLKWKSAVDLDLYCLTKSETYGEYSIYYGNRGSLECWPFIALDHDSGVGDVGGDNEENIRISKLDGHKHLLIVANIFAKRNACFASYDGSVSVKGIGKEFIVHLTSSGKGNWCIIAYIDNSGKSGPTLENVNLTLPSKPVMSNFLGGRYLQHEGCSNTSFIKRLFGF